MLGMYLLELLLKPRKIAREAIALIEVEYKVLKPVTDPFEALSVESPKIHESGNLLSNTKIERGDSKKAEKESTFVTKGTYKTQRIEHAFLEIECCVAKPLDGGVEVFSQSQGVYEDRNSISKILGLPSEKVVVVLMPNGGGFGGKEDISVSRSRSFVFPFVTSPGKSRPDSPRITLYASQSVIR